MTIVGILHLQDVLDQQLDFYTWDEFSNILLGTNRHAMIKLLDNLQVPDLQATTMFESQDVFIDVVSTQGTLI